MQFPFEMNDDEYKFCCKGLPLLGSNFTVRGNKIKFNDHLGTTYENISYLEYNTGHGFEKLGYMPYTTRRY